MDGAWAQRVPVDNSVSEKPVLEKKPQPQSPTGGESTPAPLPGNAKVENENTDNAATGEVENGSTNKTPGRKPITEPPEIGLPDSPPVDDSSAFDPAELEADSNAEKAALEKEKNASQGIALIINGQRVIRIRATLGTYTPDRRVRSVEGRIKTLQKDPKYESLIADITTIDHGSSTNIVTGSHTLLTVTDSDAEAEGYASRQALAADFAISLKDALKNDADSRNFHALLFASVYTVVATILLALAIGAINWVFPRIYGLLERWKGTVIGALKIQKAELLSADTITDIFIGAFRVLRIICFLSVISIYLPLVLSFFPQTRSMARQGVHQLLDPIRESILPAIFSYLPNLFFIAIITLVTYYIITFTHFIFLEVDRETITIPGFDPEWSMLTYRIVRFLIVALALVLMFPYLPGAGSPAFQQVSIFLGVLFSLASTSALSHVIAGVFLTYTGAMRIGDRVKIADTVGDVVEKTLLATKIKTIKNEFITIPNGLVLGNHIVNYSSSITGGGLILHTCVTIGYDVPWPLVHKAMIEAARITPDVLDSPEPFVWQTELGDFSVKYEINAYTKNPGSMAAIYAGIHRNIQDKFNEAGIEILSPTYSAVRDGNRVTIPDEHLDKDYKSPAFQVSVSGPVFSSMEMTEKNKGQ